MPSARHFSWALAFCPGVRHIRAIFSCWNLHRHVQRKPPGELIPFPWLEPHRSGSVRGNRSANQSTFDWKPSGRSLGASKKESGDRAEKSRRRDCGPGEQSQGSEPGGAGLRTLQEIGDSWGRGHLWHSEILSFPPKNGTIGPQEAECATMLWFSKVDRLGPAL